MKKLVAGVIGSAGYTGGELVRVLMAHPQVEIGFLQSRSQAGKKISSVHTDLFHSELRFVAQLSDDELSQIDVLFLALAHGESREYFGKHKDLPAKLKVIDLGHDFRLNATSRLGDRKFIYGLPELNREKIRSANSVANPGCFATAIQLSLLPLAAEKNLGEVAVTGITGSTGAGQGLSSTAHFSFRENNIQAYKTLRHQHMGEVGESLSQLQAGDHEIAFVPWRGDFTRGIFVSSIVTSTLSEQQATSMYRKFYEDHPFVRVSDSSEQSIDLKSIVNTNYAWLELHHVGKKLVVNVALDNLLKGASGQAVQNMNLMFGFAENAGLQLKAAGF